MELVDIWVGLRTFFSAGTYRFSLATIIYAMVDFTKQFIKYRDLCQISCPNFSCGNESYHCLRAYDTRKSLIFGCLILFFAHTVNAIMFMFKFDRREAPLKSAYFLPFMQLWRLLDLVRKTWSWKGFQDFQLEEKNTLFTQLSLSLETIPMYTIQLYAWCYKLTHYIQGIIMYEAVKGLALSTASSFLSSLFLGGLTIQATCKNAKSLKMKTAIGVSSGVFLSTATYLRCSSLIILYYHKSVKNRINIYEGKGNTLNIPVSSTVNSLLAYTKLAPYLVFYFISLSLNEVRQKTPLYRRFIKASALAYISIQVGPLYPLVSEALEQDQLGTLQYRIKLLVVAMANLTMDYLMVVYAEWFRLQADFIVCAVVYIISIALYAMFDKKCGRMDDCSPETTKDLVFHEANHPENGINDHWQGKQLTMSIPSVVLSNTSNCPIFPNQ